MAHKKKERSRRGRRPRSIRAIWARLSGPEAIDEALTILLQAEPRTGDGQPEPVDKPAENPRI